MITVSEHTQNNEKGILITYENGEEVFFTAEETEEIKKKLDRINLRESILNILKNGKMTLGDLVNVLNIDPDVINEKIALLEYEGIVEIKSSKKFEDREFGTLHAPYVELAKKENFTPTYRPEITDGKNQVTILDSQIPKKLKSKEVWKHDNRP